MATNAVPSLAGSAVPGSQELACFFKSLGDETRLRIMRLLVRRECCVCEVVEEVGLSQPLVSHHLRVLRKAGLIRDRRDGQWVYYSVDLEALARLNAAFSGLFGMADLPPSAYYGAGKRC